VYKRQEPGWNLIANPYGFAVPTAWIELPAGAEQSFYGQALDGTSTTYVDVDTLAVGAGYFVKLDEEAPAADLLIDVVNRGTGTSGRARGSTPQFRLDHPRWSAGIRVHAGERSDLTCRIGLRDGAGVGWDPYDRSKPPPPPGRHVSLVLDDGHGRWLLEDWRDLDAIGQAWTLALSANARGDTCVIECDSEPSLPAGWRLVAIDMDTLDEFDLLTTPWPTYRIDSGDFVKRWRLVAGSPGFIASARDEVEANFEEAVSALSLSAPWPNPFRSSLGTSVSMSVPSNTTGDLEVFDLRGRRLRTLHAGWTPQGKRSFTWFGLDDEGRALPSGVYIMRLTTPTTRVAHKVTLVR
jgi:hypothetical protein